MGESILLEEKMKTQDTLFIWIPKNAGTSIYKTLQHHIGMRLIINDFEKFDNNGNVTFGHIHVPTLVDQELIERDWFDKAYKFAVLRDPYERFVSLWFDCKHSNLISYETTLYEFLEILCREKEGGRLHPSTRDKFAKCSSQLDWIFHACDSWTGDVNKLFKKQFGISLGLENVTPELTGCKVDLSLNARMTKIFEFLYPEVKIL